MATGVVAAALASKPVRERVARLIPVDPDNPVHSLALVLAVIVVGTSAASLAFTDVLASDQQLPPLALGDLVAQELPFLLIGLAGVGIWVRRDFRASAARLGIVVPAWWHIVLALAAAGAFYAFEVIIGSYTVAKKNLGADTQGQRYGLKDIEPLVRRLGATFSHKDLPTTFEAVLQFPTQLIRLPERGARWGKVDIRRVSDARP